MGEGPKSLPCCLIMAWKTRGMCRPALPFWYQKFPQEVGWKTVDKADGMRCLDKKIEVDALSWTILGKTLRMATRFCNKPGNLWKFENMFDLLRLTYSFYKYDHLYNCEPFLGGFCPSTVSTKLPLGNICNTRANVMFVFLCWIIHATFYPTLPTLEKEGASWEIR